MNSKIGIVTVNYNGKKYINKFIRSIHEITYPNYELFLLDNASTDQSVKIIKAEFPELPLVCLDRNVGIAAGNNLGIKYFQSHGNVDYILFLNPDTIHESSFLDELEKYADERTIVAPRSYMTDMPSILNTTVGDFNWRRGVLVAPFYNHPDSPQSKKVQEVEIAATYALLVPMSAFSLVGLMDEAYFMYCDDVDFVLRSKKAGFKVLYNPQSVIYHHEKGSTGGAKYSATSTYFFYRNRAYLMRKLCAQRRRFYLFLLIYLMEWSLQYIRFTMMRRSDLSIALFKALRDFLQARMGNPIDKLSWSPKTGQGVSRVRQS